MIKLIIFSDFEVVIGVIFNIFNVFYAKIILKSLEFVNNIPKKVLLEAFSILLGFAPINKL